MDSNNTHTPQDIITRIHQDYITKQFPKQYNHDFQILSTIRYDPNLSPTPPLQYSDITNSNFFLLSEHTSRLKFTLGYFQNQFHYNDADFEITESGLLHQLINAFQQSQKPVMMPYKIRLLVDVMTGEARVEIHDTPYRQNLLAGLPTTSTTKNHDDMFDSTLVDFSHVETSDDDDDDDDDIWHVYLDTSPTLISPFTSFKTTRRDVYTTARGRVLPGIRPQREEVLLYNTSRKLMEGSITNVAIMRRRDGKLITPMLSSGCLCGVMRSYLLRKGYIEEDSIEVDDIKPGDYVWLFNGVMGVVRGRIMG